MEQEVVEHCRGATVLLSQNIAKQPPAEGWIFLVGGTDLSVSLCVDRPRRLRIKHGSFFPLS